MDTRLIGQRIQQRREELGLTMVDLSARVGVAASTIMRYEKGQFNRIKLPIIESLAAALDVDPSWLAGVSSEKLPSNRPRTQNSAPSLSDEALEIARQFDSVSPVIQNVVKAALAAAVEEMKAARKPSFTILETKQPKKPTKVIPLYGARYAAGTPESPGDIEAEDYETEDLRAEFAIHVNGNSMEPYLHDGSVALCTKRMPRDGEVGAFYLDGGFLVKQVCQDIRGTIYLFSLNRKRKDADEVIQPDSGRELLAMGTVLMDQRIPLPD